ncbi:MULTISPECIES: hypothetical protein [unclassified Paraburkholderia]|uniref:hypothetical protein n=1 Tax=unclassified Paraburkholderia TaxID=2615204 RepID=UPI002AB0502D|nr:MULTISPECIES: hypothetical protein [unclassified Paraburkholderia]
MGQKYEHLGAEERGVIFAMKLENRSAREIARVATLAGHDQPATRVALALAS